jgi:uncharacterized protein
MRAPCKEDILAEWIRSDSERWSLLGHVRNLDLPDCWVAAGFVREIVWALLHRQAPLMTADVDVIWFERQRCSEELDRSLETRLKAVAPVANWSVKNQARMHVRNGDRAYTSSKDAMMHWPETATAVGIRRTEDDRCEICAPFGLDDLFALNLRPAGAFRDTKRGEFDLRVEQKRWLDRFPLLSICN